MDHREFSSHVGAVDALAAHGLDIPREWLALRQRLVDFMALDRPATDRLAAAVVSGTGDLAALRADALAEEASNSITQAAVGNAVADAAYARLRALWAPQSAKAYRQVAQRFDGLAVQFTAAARAVDPEADSDTVLRCDERARAAWFSCAELAEQLDLMLPVLCAAASLAGAPSGVGRLTEDADNLRLALACDPKKTHRRRVWEAWRTTGGRCGRWAALRRLDIAIRAHGNPAKLEAYEQPKPYVLTWEPGKSGGYEKVVHDLNDGPKAAVAVGDGWE